MVMEPILFVKRQPSDANQTLGTMELIEETISKFKCVTMELPDLNNDGIADNEQGKSCIPKNTYDCEKVPATAAIPYEHISITNVPGRSGVCIHKANYYKQLRGCIAVGDKHTDINGDGEKDVTNSGITFIKLMVLLPDKFKIVIQ